MPDPTPAAVALAAAWLRLYLPAGCPGELSQAFGRGEARPVSLVDAAGRVRALRLCCRDAEAWPALAAMCAALERDFGWPAPGVAVAAETGFQLWFALAEPLAVDRAAGLLRQLAARHLAEVAPRHLRCDPGSGAAGPVCLVPARETDDERWSAFIDPGMAPLFAAGFGLDFPPPPERQAEMLAGLRAVPATALAAALAALDDAPSPPLPKPAADPSPAVDRAAHLAGPYASAGDFLRAVMNDPATPLPLRIEAARALLPGESTPAAATDDKDRP